MFRLRTLALAALPILGLSAGTADAGWVYRPYYRHPVVVVRPAPVVVAAVPEVTVAPAPVVTVAPEVIVRPPVVVAPRVYYRYWR